MSDGPARPGRVETITSVSNPRVKAIRALAMKKARTRDGLFVAEGLKLAADALAGGWTIRTLVRGRSEDESEGSASRLDEVAATVRARGGDIIVANDKVLSAITRRDNAQKAVAIIDQKNAPLSAVSPDSDRLWLALDRVRDPGNLGTCLRTADALGAAGVVLVGETTDPFALEAVRASMGSLFHLPIVQVSERDFITHCGQWKNAGGAVVGTHLAGAIDHRDIDYASAPQILLMGNEQKGLTDALAEACSSLALIAMDGEADSLNLAVATGIVLFEARRHVLGRTETGTN